MTAIEKAAGAAFAALRARRADRRTAATVRMFAEKPNAMRRRLAAMWAARR
jgi:hypothetical protein